MDKYKKSFMVQLVKCSIYITIYLIIGDLWQLAEKMIYGVITPRSIDTVIGLILAYSIYKNLHLRVEVQ